MSLNVPSNFSKKEFVLEAVNGPPMELEKGGDSYLVLPSLESFKHVDKNMLPPGTLMVGAFTQMGLAAGGFVALAQGVLSGIGLASVFIGTGIAGACLMNQANIYFNPPQEPKFMPSNSAKLNDEVISTALRVKQMPNKFKDPISLEIIETPVAFSDDPTETIYDITTVDSLLENGIAQNPLNPKMRLDFSKLVYLPEVKKQIEDLKAQIITDA